MEAVKVEDKAAMMILSLCFDSFRCRYLLVFSINRLYIVSNLSWVGGGSLVLSLLFVAVKILGEEFGILVEIYVNARSKYYVSCDIKHTNICIGFDENERVLFFCDLGGKRNEKLVEACCWKFDSILFYNSLSL